MTLTKFLDRLTHIWETTQPFIRSKNPDPILQRTTRLIDTIVSEDWPVVRYIETALEEDTKKTPLYFAHRKDLAKKNRLRKQDFLALYEYLKAQKKEPQFFRSGRMYILEKGETPEGQNPKIQLRIWMYHTEPITEDELDQEWENVIDTANEATHGGLMYSLEQGEGDELNEEIDEDEGGDWNEWQGVLCLDDVCYSYSSGFKRKI